MFGQRKYLQHLYLPSYHTDNGDWEPRLYEYQQRGANVLFFTFINPETMRVPEAFKKLGRVQSDYSLLSLDYK